MTDEVDWSWLEFGESGDPVAEARQEQIGDMDTQVQVQEQLTSKMPPSCQNLDPRLLQSDLNADNRRSAVALSSSSELTEGGMGPAMKSRNKTTAGLSGYYTMSGEQASTRDLTTATSGASVKARPRKQERLGRQKQQQAETFRSRLPVPIQQQHLGTFRSRFPVAILARAPLETIIARVKNDNRAPIKFEGDTFPLILTEVEDGLAFLEARIPLSVDADDWRSVERDTLSYLRRIMVALTRYDYISAADEKSRKWPAMKNGMAAYWKKWQNEQAHKLHGLLSVPDLEIEINSRALALFGEVLKLHKDGARTFHPTTDRSLKCSERIEAVIEAIADYAMVRVCLLQGFESIKRLAANPKLFCDEKKEHLKSNGKRAGWMAKATNMAAPVVAPDPTRAKIPSFDSRTWEDRFTCDEIDTLQTKTNRLKTGKLSKKGAGATDQTPSASAARALQGDEVLEIGQDVIAPGTTNSSEGMGISVPSNTIRGMALLGPSHITQGTAIPDQSLASEMAQLHHSLFGPSEADIDSAETMQHGAGDVTGLGNGLVGAPYPGYAAFPQHAPGQAASLHHGQVGVTSRGDAEYSQYGGRGANLERSHVDPWLPYWTDQYQLNLAQAQPLPGQMHRSLAPPMDSNQFHPAPLSIGQFHPAPMNHGHFLPGPMTASQFHPATRNVNQLASARMNANHLDPALMQPSVGGYASPRRTNDFGQYGPMNGSVADTSNHGYNGVFIASPRDGVLDDGLGTDAGGVKRGEKRKRAV